ncbi:MAG TPA: hypothetical protein VFR23_14460 [Jiangellaceae bacterium]|nr:hypothetical protein [Jiangellaceae bacterium]
MTPAKREKPKRTQGGQGLTPADEEKAVRLRKWDPGPGARIPAPRTTEQQELTTEQPSRVPARTSLVGSLIVSAMLLILVVAVIVANV